MASSGFTRVPTEIFENWAQYLEPSDLASFRLVCKQAYAQTLEVVRQTFFSVWRTSLMGSDLRKLEEISLHTEVRKYVKTISIKDDGKIKDPSKLPLTEIPSIASLHVWPQDKRQMVTSSGIGVENLRAMLLDKRLCPETIKIEDYRSRNTISYTGSAQVLARDIIDGADLAIVAIKFRPTADSRSDVILILSLQHQGQGVGFSLLRFAELDLLSDATSFWSEQVLYHTPILEKLKDTYPGFNTQEFDTLRSAGNPISSIKQLSLVATRVPARTVLTILGNSKYSLTHVLFSLVVLREEPGWHTLLYSLGSDFPALTSFYLEFLSEPPHGCVIFQELSKDEIAEEYRSGLKLFESGLPDHSRLACYYERPDASGILKILAASIVLAAF